MSAELHQLLLYYYLLCYAKGTKPRLRIAEIALLTKGHRRQIRFRECEDFPPDKRRLFSKNKCLSLSSSSTFHGIPLPLDLTFCPTKKLARSIYSCASKDAHEKINIKLNESTHDRVPSEDNGIGTGTGTGSDAVLSPGQRADDTRKQLSMEHGYPQNLCGRRALQARNPQIGRTSSHAQRSTERDFFPHHYHLYHRLALGKIMEPSSQKASKDSRVWSPRRACCYP